MTDAFSFDVTATGAAARLSVVPPASADGASAAVFDVSSGESLALAAWPADGTSDLSTVDFGTDGGARAARTGRKAHGKGSGLWLGAMGLRRKSEPPIAPQFNLVPNPRFHNNATDGWHGATDLWGGGDNYCTRVTSVPWGDLPAGADAAGLCSTAGASISNVEPLPTPYIGVSMMPWAATFGAPGTCEALIVLFMLDASNNYLDGVPLVTYSTPFSGDEWHVVGGSVLLPALEPYWPDYRRVCMYVWCHAVGDSSTPGYVTQLGLGCDGFGAGYGDGDSPGWHWLGASHNSPSETL